MGVLTPSIEDGLPIGADSGLVAAATATATLTPAAGRTAYLQNIEVTGSGATAATQVALTVTGLAGGTRTWCVAVPAGVGVSIQPLQFDFNPPLPGSAPGVALVASMPTFGAGAASACITIHGIQL